MVVKNNNKTYYNINNINDFQDCLLDETKNNYNLENNYILRANLNWNDIKQELRNPIKLFSGEFDGNNFQISNFQMTNYQRNGLFSTTSKATIKNLILNINGKITGLDYVSALVGYANETEISNCKITGVVNVFSKGLYVGLYCGFSNSCTFTDTHVDTHICVCVSTHV